MKRGPKESGVVALKKKIAFLLHTNGLPIALFVVCGSSSFA
jgi:hypothetical protein